VISSRIEHDRNCQSGLELTLCANRSCCRLRPVRNLEKDVCAAEAREAEESARCIFILSHRARNEKRN
jgi:hypothetical protein